MIEKHINGEKFSSLIFSFPVLHLKTIARTHWPPRESHHLCVFDNAMNRLEQVDDKTFQGDLESLRPKNAAEDINEAPSVGKKANRTSLDGQSDALAIESPAKGNSCLSPRRTFAKLVRR